MSPEQLKLKLEGLRRAAKNNAEIAPNDIERSYWEGRMDAYKGILANYL